METRFIEGGEYVDRKTYIMVRDENSQLRERIAELENQRDIWCEDCKKAWAQRDGAIARYEAAEARLDAIKDIMRSSSFMHPRDALSRIYAALGGNDET